MAASKRRPRVAVTMGDPAGIGPEICLRLLADSRVLRRCVPVVFGNAEVLDRVARACRLPGPDRVVTGEQGHSDLSESSPAVVDPGGLEAYRVRPGRVQASCGRAGFRFLEAAATRTMNGEFAALATGPINKQALQAGGIPFSGHTDYLAAATGTPAVYMMLASDELRVSMVTGHVGVERVSRELTKARVLEAIRLTRDAVVNLRGETPRLAVSGLNPHAGEGGLFGSGEEEHVIRPAVEAARREGMEVDGPLPADTLFVPSVRSRYQAVVTMYHDQGHVPFKMISFDRGIHMTLGLPLVRTSVAHGTAFDIAWTGRASPQSLIQAVLWAGRLAERKRAVRGRSAAGRTAARRVG